MEQPPRVQCTECHKDMVPVWANGFLDGWACDCSHTVKAILRERWFREENYEHQKGRR